MGGDSRRYPVASLEAGTEVLGRAGAGAGELHGRRGSIRTRIAIIKISQRN